MNSLCDVCSLIHCLAVAFINGVVGTHYDEYLLGLLDSTKLAVQSSERIAEVVQLLDR